VTQIRKAPQVVQNVVTCTVIVGVDNPSGRTHAGDDGHVKLVVAQKPSALKVPNAALRFRLPRRRAAADHGGARRGRCERCAPSTDQLRELLVKGLSLTRSSRKSWNRSSDAVSSSGGSGNVGGRVAVAVWIIREAQRARIRDILTDEQKARYEQITLARGEARSGTAGRVWIIGGDGKPRPIGLTLGLNDGASTEVLRGECRRARR
jgi:HlyD family secretion protein